MNRVFPVLSSVFLLFALILNGCAGTPANGMANTTDTPSDGRAEPLITQQPIVVTREVPVYITETGTQAAAQTPPEPTRCAPDDADELDEIRIGALLPLSHSESFLAGIAMQTALNLAISHLNDGAGLLGKPVRLFLEDTMGDPEVGSARAERLITQDCVIGLVGIYHSRVALAVKEIAHQYGVPIIFSEPYHDAVTEDAYPEVFRVAPAFSMVIDSDKQWLRAVGDYNGDGHQLVVFLVDSRGLGAGRTEAVTARLQEQEVETATLAVNLSTETFSAIIARIVSLDRIPDVIAIRFNTNASLIFQNELHEAGFGPAAGTLIVTKQSALNSADFWQQVPDGDYTIVDRVGPWHTTVSEIGRTFAAEYQSAMDRWPESYAFAAYDSLLLLAAAVEDAESLAAPAVITALEEINIELAAGVYHFPYNSQNTPAQTGAPTYMWHQWPDPPLLLLQYSQVDQRSTDMTVLWPPLYSTTDEVVLQPSGE